MTRAWVYSRKFHEKRCEYSILRRLSVTSAANSGLCCLKIFNAFAQENIIRQKKVVGNNINNSSKSWEGGKKKQEEQSLG